jgi:ubiquinone/menaquinone biosynthesis C-methylase UbiE
VTNTPADVRHRFFAMAWPLIAAAGERFGLSKWRRQMLKGAGGRVIEVGAGAGANFAHYPATVTEVAAVEPEPALRRRAIQAARKAGVRVQVRAGNAERLPFDDGEFDTAVTSLVLCSVPDQGRALAEIRRVLRPGGQLRFLEHVRARGGGLLRLQRVLDATVWPPLAGGCHLTRDTERAIREAGFEISRIRRFSFQPCLIAAPTSPQIVGTAVVAAPPAAGKRSSRRG